MTSDEFRNLTRKLKKQDCCKSFSDIIGPIVGGIISLLFVGLIACSFFIYNVWAYAYVGKIMWAWFIAPTFGIPSISIMQAWGISMLIGMWTKTYFVWKAKDERTTLEKIAEFGGLILYPWLVLGMGWIALSLMK